MGMLLSVLKISDLQYQIIDVNCKLEGLKIDITQEDFDLLGALNLRIIVVKFLRKNKAYRSDKNTEIHFLGDWGYSDSYDVMIAGESI